MKRFQLPERPVVLNVHATLGETITGMADSSDMAGLTFVTGPYGVRQGSLHNFGANTEHARYLITDPVDALPHRITTDLRHFTRRRPQVWSGHENNPLYVKRCLDAVELVRYALSRSGSVITRDRLRDIFAGLRDELVPGQYDLYAFDAEGRLDQEPGSYSSPSTAPSSSPSRCSRC